MQSFKNNNPYTFSLLLDFLGDRFDIGWVWRFINDVYDDLHSSDIFEVMIKKFISMNFYTPETLAHYLLQWFFDAQFYN